jgi:uncharacterized protein with HEPN domain
MPKRYPDLLVDDMLDCLQSIQQFVSDLSSDEILASRLHRDAIIRNLEVLGEAANQLPKPLQAHAPEVPWSQIISLRNRFIHEYHGVNWDVLIPTILKDLPLLKTQLETLRTFLKTLPL